MSNRRFEIEVLNQNKLVKENELQEITNPVLFNSASGPTPDGLLSNEIFGITRDERAGIFAYIDLHDKFIQPYYYKIWLLIDKRLKGCIYGTNKFIINSKGFLEENENGETGIGFLRKNIEKIKFKDTKQAEIIKALMNGKSNMFTDKFIIIPPYYRDVDTRSGGRVGVGEVNKLYMNLMNNVNALKTSDDYGLEMADGIRGRIQDIMLEIYNWFTVGESIIGGEHTGAGIFKKFGVMHRSIQAKSTDNSARLVISSSDLAVENVEDLMVDLDHVAVPLSACCVIAYPFIIYELRQFFNNEFGGKIYYDYIDKQGNNKQVELDDPLIAFSDDRFDKELNEFIHGYSNRLKKVKVPNKQGIDLNLKFKGYYITPEEYAKGVRETGSIIDRDLTWMDLFYICACKATKDKIAIVTRYPIDSHFSCEYAYIRVSSTVETEPMMVMGEYYRWYPKVRQYDIGSNTSNKFIDTLVMTNLNCPVMGADYDGDQVTIKMVYTEEANKELKKYMNSNAFYIPMSGINCKMPEHEAIQAMYNLTKILPETKLVDPVF